MQWLFLHIILEQHKKLKYANSTKLQIDTRPRLGN